MEGSSSLLAQCKTRPAVRFILDVLANACVTHADGAVDDPTLEHDDALCVHVALDARGPLNLDALVRRDVADDRATDDGFLYANVTVDRSLSPEQQLSRAPDRAFDQPFDLHDTIAVDVTDDLHSG